MNKNSQGNAILIVLIVLFISFASSMTLLYINRDKVSDYLNKLMKPEKKNVFRTQEVQEVKTIEKAQETKVILNNETVENTKPAVNKEKDDLVKSIARIEQLDKDFFKLFTIENLSNSNPEIAKANIKKLREINENYKQELTKYGSKASMCANIKNIENTLRDAEQIYVVRKPSLYQKEVFEDNFPRKRIDVERNYQQYCKSIYEEIGAKILEF